MASCVDSVLNGAVDEDEEGTGGEGMGTFLPPPTPPPKVPPLVPPHGFHLATKMPKGVASCSHAVAGAPVAG